VKDVESMERALNSARCAIYARDLSNLRGSVGDT
jgi:hypothetical protein